MSKLEKFLTKYLSQELVEKLNSEEATDSDLNKAYADLHNVFLAKFKNDSDFTKDVSSSGYSAGRAKTIQDFAKMVGINDDSVDINAIKERIEFLTKQSDPEKLKSKLQEEVDLAEKRVKATYEEEKNKFINEFKKSSAIERTIYSSLVGKETLIPAEDILTLAMNKLTSSYETSVEADKLVIKGKGGANLFQEDKVTAATTNDVVASILNSYIKDSKPQPEVNVTEKPQVQEPSRVVVTRNDPSRPVDPAAYFGA
jgi:hypothetical protein